MKTQLSIISAAVVLIGVCNVQAVNVDFYSDAIIRPGDVYDIVSVYDTLPLQTKVDMFGGSIKSIHSYDSSIFNMHAGSWGELGLGASGGYICDSSTVNIFGGSIRLDSLVVKDSATLNLYGGNFFSGNSPGFSESSTVNIYGYDFSYDGVWTLTGFLSDGSGFMFNELFPSNYVHLNLIVVPEPATIFLLSLGILLCRKRI